MNPTLTEAELRAIRYWLPQVYLAGPAKDIAPLLDQINSLVARIAEITAPQASQNTENQNEP